MMLKIVEALGQGLEVGEIEVFGLLFADYLVGSPGTRDGLLKQRWHVLGSGDSQQMSRSVPSRYITTVR